MRLAVWFGLEGLQVPLLSLAIFDTRGASCQFIRLSHWACYCVPNICVKIGQRAHPCQRDWQHGPGAGNFFSITPNFERGGASVVAELSHSRKVATEIYLCQTKPTKIAGVNERPNPWPQSNHQNHRPTSSLIAPLPARSLTGPQPARPLGEHGQRLWNKIVAEFDIDDAPVIELLTAARSLDRAEQCAECIKRDGPTVRGPTGIRAHPCIREELSCRNFTARALRQLGVTLEPLRALGRPPGSGH